MKKLKMRNFFKITLAIGLSLVICTVTMGSVTLKTYTAYIEPQLMEILNNATTTELIPVDIWLYEIDTDEVDAEVMAKTGVGLKAVKNETTVATLTNAQIDSYIETERSVYATAQTEQSQAFMNKYSGIFNSKAIENNSLFVSKYTPVIRIKANSLQIGALAKDSSVEAIYYSPDLEFENCMNISTPLISADYTRDTVGLDGSGVKIGMIESEMPNKSESYLPSSKIICNQDATPSTESYSEHANAVAYILIGNPITINGQSAKGLVPNATLYATNFDDFSNWHSQVEWLISQGVNVINMSCGTEISTGSYGSIDRWVDHIAIHHNIHFVVSAGNDSTSTVAGNICAPGLAYNVITVGNLNDKNTLSLMDDEIDNSSSYYEYVNSESPEKPDLVAPGSGIITGNGSWSGTSFSAPMVTAIIAQLCQANPQLKTQQNAMKAILSATTVNKPNSYVPSDAEYDIFGAGLLSTTNAYKSVISGSSLVTSFPANTVDGTVQSHSFTITSSKNRFRIALTWLNYAYIQSSNHLSDITDENSYMADLDLYLVDSNSNQIAYSIKSTGNVEIVDIENLPAGTYTMRVRAYDGSQRDIYYSLAWWHSDL